MSSPRRDFLKELLAARTLPDLIASLGGRRTMGVLLNRDAATVGILKGVTYVTFDAEVTPTTLVTSAAKKWG